MTRIGARVLLDSVSEGGARLTTMEWTYPRFIHAEVMTYRMFSRNSASSRAIPTRKTLRSVLTDPARPVFWGRNRRGMQAGDELTGWRFALARVGWEFGRVTAAASAWMMAAADLHKQTANRRIEPDLWMTTILTGSPVAFENVWRQRCHPAAQPEFRVLADAARLAYEASVPVERWAHLPLLQPDELATIDTDLDHPEAFDVLCRMSVARCARVSYLTHDGRRSWEEDLKLYDKLHLESDDGEVPHTSPTEHVAFSCVDPRRRFGNLFGWKSWRARVDPYWVELTGGEVPR